MLAGKQFFVFCPIRQRAFRLMVPCEMNNKTSHTPGPWAVKDATGQRDYIMAGTESVAQITRLRPKTATGLIRWEEMTANARLIAAAPELLAALDGLMTALAIADKQWIGLNMNNPGQKKAYEIEQAAKIIAERAITKATS